MAFLHNPTLHDSAILPRAVENVFRKLIRLLIGKMSLKKLQEMIQIIFVEEAEVKLQQEAPGKNVALSNLASITDLDTRTITKIKRLHDSNKPIFLDSNFLKGFTPGFKVLDLWINDDKYIDRKTKKPVPLSFSSEGICFEKLVEEAISARGVTARSMLQRLIENNFIQINLTTNMLEVVREDYIFLSSAELDMIDIGFSAIASLATTVAHNIKNASNKESLFYQRGCWTYRLSKTKKREFQKEMSNFLHAIDKDAKGKIAPFEENEEQSGEFAAGISMFYFEEEIQN